MKSLRKAFVAAASIGTVCLLAANGMASTPATNAVPWYGPHYSSIYTWGPGMVNGHSTETITVQLYLGQVSFAANHAIPTVTALANNTMECRAVSYAEDMSTKPNEGAWVKIGSSSAKSVVSTVLTPVAIGYTNHYLYIDCKIPPTQALVSATYKHVP